MTEDEAKTRWCPFARTVTLTDGRAPTGYPVHNRYGGEGLDAGTFPHTSKCIASDCMAWRTRHQWLDNAQQEPGWVSYAPYAFEPGEGQERDDGYCGLAGAPQC